MDVMIGIVLALLACWIARVGGFERDRGFYPAALIAIATYDVLFAVMGGTTSALLIESVFATMFVGISLLGLRLSPWMLVAGFAAHGLADLVHDSFSPEAGIPAWWPGFCCAFDVVMAAVLAVRLTLLRRGLVIPGSARPVA